MPNIINLDYRTPEAYDWSTAGSDLTRIYRTRIYRNDPDPQLRIMAVAAIYAIGDKRSIDAINRHNALVRHTHVQQRLPYTPSRVEQIGDRAVRRYYHASNTQRRTDRIQRRIDRHRAKALQHNEKASGLGHRLTAEASP